MCHLHAQHSISGKGVNGCGQSVEMRYRCMEYDISVLYHHTVGNELSTGLNDTCCVYVTCTHVCINNCLYVRYLHAHMCVIVYTYVTIVRLYDCAVWQDNIPRANSQPD